MSTTMDTKNGTLVDWGLPSSSEGANQNLGYGILIILAVLTVWFARSGGSKFPELNPRGRWEFTDITRTRRFMQNSIDTLLKGQALYPTSPYQLFCDFGQVTMISPDNVEHIKSDRRFDFAMSASDDSHGYIPGFDGLSDDPQMPKIVTRYLTKALTKVTAPLSEEAALVIDKVLADPTDWKTLKVSEDVMKIVSRMSSRVFMGEELCRDDGWNTAATDYAVKVFTAGDKMREYPRWMRPYVHWFLPCCQDVRKALAVAREYLEPHVAKREKIKAEALSRGEKCPFDDSIEWFAQAGSKRAPADCQISLSLVAIHTTTDLLSSTLINIAKHPELIEPLREEVIRVLSGQGLKKTALYDLKLMDSVFKETQRLKPVLLSWKRQALEDVTLPSGLKVKKGSKVAVNMTHMWSDERYGKGDEFDGYRFVRMRDTPGQDHMAHLVSTSQNHLGFGHGVHACPGRFFASNEVKIALCHLILKYDWKLPEGEAKAEPIAYGMAYSTNPAAKLMVRRRKEELDFSKLEC